jgi:hypothetical protein
MNTLEYNLDDDLDTSWIDDLDKLNNIHHSYFREPMKNIDFFILLVDSNDSILKIKKENHRFSTIDKNCTFTNSFLIQFIERIKNTYSKGKMRYKLYDVLLYNIDIEPGKTDIFKIKAYALNPYGYVSIDINNENIDVCYTQVIKETQNKYNKSKSIIKPRPLSAPDKIIDKGINKERNPYNSLSLSTSNKIAKLSRINKLYYRITITKDSATVNYITKNSLNISAFASNFKYQTRNICNKIKNNPDSSIKSENKDIYCYKKAAKKDKK